MSEDRAPPYGEVDAKRPFAIVAVTFDWHDYLANLRAPGAAVALNDVVRLRRLEATGLEYKCTTAGVTGWRNLVWPGSVGQTLNDGSVVWTAQAVSSASLRTTITLSTFPTVSGVTYGTTSETDLRYAIQVSGGTANRSYEIRHRVTLANTEQQEALAMLDVRD